MCISNFKNFQRYPLDPFEKKVGDKAQEKTIRATMKQHGGQYINTLNIPA